MKGYSLDSTICSSKSITVRPIKCSQKYERAWFLFPDKNIWFQYCSCCTLWSSICHNLCCVKRCVCSYCSCWHLCYESVVSQFNVFINKDVSFVFSISLLSLYISLIVDALISCIGYVLSRQNDALGTLSGHYLPQHILTDWGKSWNVSVKLPVSGLKFEHPSPSPNC